MNTDCQPSPPQPASSKLRNVKLFGVGSGGTKLLATLKARELTGIHFIAVNTEAVTVPDGITTVQAENKLLRGLGTGGDPERGRAAAEEVQARFRALCEATDVVILVTTLGGGAGTGMAPVVARVAREAGALVIAFATTPFDCEGKRRHALATEGLQALKSVADGVICMPNQRVFKLIAENTALLETFSRTNELVADAVVGLWRLLVQQGLMEIRFEELAAVLRGEKGQSACASVEAAGPSRSAEALEKLLAHPMLDAGEVFKDAESLLVSLTAGPDLSMAEVKCVLSGLQSRCLDAQVVLGAAVQETFGSKLAVTMIVRQKPAETKEESSPRYGNGREEFTGHLLNDAETPKNNSRFVPPAASGAPEETDKSGARTKPAMKARKPAPRMRQGQLPLEIVSKGRFDKSEPTIHRGEDLDVPTYIRRGVSLN